MYRLAAWLTVRDCVAGILGAIHDDNVGEGLDMGPSCGVTPKGLPLSGDGDSGDRIDDTLCGELSEHPGSGDNGV